MGESGGEIGDDGAGVNALNDQWGHDKFVILLGRPARN